jgi:hypothetical protein
LRDLPDFFHGCKVFPCVPNGKEPATKEGWHIASNDPAQIAEWKRINPDFNWALATGLSGLFVIDVDPNGLDWWGTLLERDAAVRDAVERAFQVRTPRGGLHVYFKGEGPSTASRIAAGIDTRGGIVRDGKVVSGGYVLLPGSKTDAGIYSALPGGGLIQLPESISKIIPERKKTDTLGLEKNPEADKPRNVQWALDLLNNYVASGRVSVQGQGGNNLAFQVAASILDKAISPGVAFDLLWEHWNPIARHRGTIGNWKPSSATPRATGKTPKAASKDFRRTPMRSPTSKGRNSNRQCRPSGATEFIFCTITPTTYRIRRGSSPACCPPTASACCTGERQLQIVPRARHGIVAGVRNSRTMGRARR